MYFPCIHDLPPKRLWRALCLGILLLKFSLVSCIAECTVENEGPVCSSPSSSGTQSLGMRVDLARSLRAPATTQSRQSSFSPVRSPPNDRGVPTARHHRQMEGRDIAHNSNQRRSRTNPQAGSHRNSGALVHNDTSVRSTSHPKQRLWSPYYYRPIYEPLPLRTTGSTGARFEDVIAERDGRRKRPKRTVSMSPPRDKFLTHTSGSSVPAKSCRVLLHPQYLRHRHLAPPSSSESEYEAHSARSTRSTVAPSYFSHCDADSEASTESEGHCRCSLDSNMDSNQGTHDSGSDIPSDVSSSASNVYSKTLGDEEIGHSGKDPPSDTTSVQLEPTVLKIAASQSFPHHCRRGASTSRCPHEAKDTTNNVDSSLSVFETSDVSPFVSDCCTSGNSDSNAVTKLHLPKRLQRYTGSKTCDCKYHKENVPFVIPEYYNSGAVEASSSSRTKPSRMPPKIYSSKTGYYIHSYAQKLPSCQRCKHTNRVESSTKVRKSSLEPKLQRLTDSVHPEGHSQGQTPGPVQGHGQGQGSPHNLKSSCPPETSAATRCNICQANRSMTSEAAGGSSKSPSDPSSHPWLRMPSSGMQDRPVYKCHNLNGAAAATRKPLVASMKTESQGLSSKLQVQVILLRYMK